VSSCVSDSSMPNKHRSSWKRGNEGVKQSECMGDIARS
jgi:hypothetical protein